MPTFRIQPRRWPWFWPLVAFGAYGANGVTLAIAQRRLHFSLLLALLWGLMGMVLALGDLATQWREVRLDAGKLVFRSPCPWVPDWLLRFSRPGFRKGCLEVPLAGASLEWVGKTLLLHGHPMGDVRLGWGARAETLADWLQEQGLPPAVGR